MAGQARFSAGPGWGMLQLPGDPSKTMPQVVADAMAAEVVGAVEWFHDPDNVYLGDPSVRSIPDGEVRDRIAGWQAEYDKEVARYNRSLPEDLRRLRYVLADLPFGRQRALAERWERIWGDWMVANPGWSAESGDGFVHENYGKVGGPDWLGKGLCWGEDEYGIVV